jgi:DNA-binding NtrC family response regulator
MEKTILIAENEAIVAIDMKYILEKMGYDVRAMVHTGEEAIEKVREIVPAIIITCVDLSGGIDGIEAVTHIRHDYNMPVIYITSHSDSATVQRIKKMDNVELILKPFSEDDLLSTIDSALRKYQKAYQPEPLTINQKYSLPVTHQNQV